MEQPIRFPVEGTGGFRSVLRHTAFRNIWFAQLAAQLADKFLLFSLIILAYNVSGGSTPVAVTLLTYTVPAILLAPPAQYLAERRTRMAQRLGIQASAVEAKLAERAAARAAKDFARADAVRGELAAMRVEVLDTPGGTDWRVRDEDL